MKNLLNSINEIDTIKYFHLYHPTGQAGCPICSYLIFKHISIRTNTYGNYFEFLCYKCYYSASYYINDLSYSLIKTLEI